MRAWVTEFAQDAGFGRVRLEDGRVLTFDITRCKTQIPEIGAEVDVRIGDGPRGPRVLELVAVSSTPEVRELDGVLATWGDLCRALCVSPEASSPVLVPFDRSAWRGAEPEYGQSVRCQQSITRSLVEPSGWGHTKAIAVEPANISADVSSMLIAALDAHGDEESFPGYRRSQPIKPLVMSNGGPAWNQHDDWPHCACNDARTKFLGYPPNGASLDAFVRDGGRLYERGIVEDAAACPLTSASGKAWEPEEWSDVSCFVCEACGARYFTFQST